MQTQSQLSRCSQSNAEDRLINKMNYYRHMEPEREWSFLFRRIRNFSTKEEAFGLGLKVKVGICQLVKPREDIPGRGDYRQRGRRKFYKSEKAKVVWSGLYTGCKEEDIEQKAWRERDEAYQMDFNLMLSMVAIFFLAMRSCLSSGVTWQDLHVRKATDSAGQMHWKCLDRESFVSIEGDNNFANPSLKKIQDYKTF